MGGFDFGQSRVVLMHVQSVRRVSLHCVCLCARGGGGRSGRGAGDGGGGSLVNWSQATRPLPAPLYICVLPGLVVFVVGVGMLVVCGCLLGLLYHMGGAPCCALVRVTVGMRMRVERGNVVTAVLSSYMDTSLAAPAGDCGAGVFFWRGRSAVSVRGRRTRLTGSGLKRGVVAS